VIGNDVAADRTYANALLPASSRSPASPIARIQQAFQQPTLNVNVDRSLAGLVGLSEKDAATAMLTTLAGARKPLRPTAEPQDRRFVSRLDPDPAT